jgi:NAD(P)H-hydrate epimerase
VTVEVVTAAEAAQRDQTAIAAGTPSQELMRRAGEGAAHVVLTRYAAQLDRGTLLVVCGAGNNGGDGWVLASVLRRLGHRVFARPLGEPRTDDARWARGLATDVPANVECPDVVVDAVLGTGARGEPRGASAEAVLAINEHRRRGARVVALDLPSGVDADRGAWALAVRADLTVAMGTMKRGLLAARDQVGELVVIDIGLPTSSTDQATIPLIDATWLRSRLPAFAASVHKGIRKRVLLVGAAPGMAGALAFAARGAFRSGVGMVRCCGAVESLTALQVLVPQATVTAWPGDQDLSPHLGWPHALLIGPGFGADASARTRAERWLRAWTGPLVIDADGLACFRDDTAALGALLGGRAAIATPHAVEAARLLGVSPEAITADPYAAGRELASRLQATVLLKGVPTIVATVTEGGGVRRAAIARGTPALAQGGSGDLLAGIAVTLLAQMGDAHDAACCAAFVHGRAGEIAAAGRPTRGVNLDDVSGALALAWRLDDERLAEGELARLPSVGEA